MHTGLVFLLCEIIIEVTGYLCSSYYHVKHLDVFTEMLCYRFRAAVQSVEQRDIIKGAAVTDLCTFIELLCLKYGVIDLYRLKAVRLCKSRIF